MFKVICMKRGSCDDPNMPQPEVGEVCTVVCSSKYFDGKERYDLAEYAPEKYCYLASNFARLSDVDETEMEREYKTEKVR